MPASVSDSALDAYDRYGEGRHPAALNFGDCLAYACARYYRLPLLYKGNGLPADRHPGRPRGGRRPIARPRPPPWSTRPFRPR